MHVERFLRSTGPVATSVVALLSVVPPRTPVASAMAPSRSFLYRQFTETWLHLSELPPPTSTPVQLPPPPASAWIATRSVNAFQLKVAGRAHIPYSLADTVLQKRPYRSEYAKAIDMLIPCRPYDRGTEEDGRSNNEGSLTTVSGLPNCLSFLATGTAPHDSSKSTFWTSSIWYSWT